MRRLPEGLEICPDCGEARGTALRYGVYSACLCEGAQCSWCGQLGRSPISDYFDLREGCFIHVPYFWRMAHGFNCPGRAAATGPLVWGQRPASPELTRYRRALTTATWAEVRARARRAARRVGTGRDGR